MAVTRTPEDIWQRHTLDVLRAAAQAALHLRPTATPCSITVTAPSVARTASWNRVQPTTVYVAQHAHCTQQPVDLCGEKRPTVPWRLPPASRACMAGWPLRAAAAGAGTRVGASRLPQRAHTSITLHAHGNTMWSTPGSGMRFSVLHRSTPCTCFCRSSIQPNLQSWAEPRASEN